MARKKRKMLTVSIGCMFPDGPEGKATHAVHKVTLPRVHGLMLAALLKTGGTPEAAFYLANAPKLTQDEKEYITEVVEAYTNQLPIWLPGSKVCSKVWHKD